MDIEWLDFDDVIELETVDGDYVELTGDRATDAARVLASLLEG